MLERLEWSSSHRVPNRRSALADAPSIATYGPARSRRLGAVGPRWG
jgi:hypothetical protein